jgi:hypothetical protein
MSSHPPAHATFYRPAEVARMLRCSEWWVKEQARRRRIPYSWIGGSYLFTEEHIAEIVRRFEVRPIEVADPVKPARPAARRSLRGDKRDSPVLLRARPPRRVRDAAASTVTAA